MNQSHEGVLNIKPIMEAADKQTTINSIYALVGVLNVTIGLVGIKDETNELLIKEASSKISELIKKL